MLRLLSAAGSGRSSGGAVYWTNAARKTAAVPRDMARDLRLGYGRALQGSEIKGWSVALGVNDMFNRLPPISPPACANDNSTDVGTHSPIGHLVYASASIRF